MTKLPYNVIVDRIIKKNPDDPQRHRRKCKYFDDGYCFKQVMDCKGSTNCMDYKEIFDISTINSNQTKHKLLKFIVNYYSKDDRPTDDNVQNITMVIRIDDSKYNLINKELNKNKKYLVDISLTNEEMYDDFNKLYITQIFIECNGTLYKCFTLRDNIVGSYNDKDIIRFKFKIESLSLNQKIGKHSKLKWSCKDKDYGEVLFYKNKKWTK